MKHTYCSTCECRRCLAECRRRARQATERTTFEVMAERVNQGTARQRRQAREFWDAFESGRPMGSDDV